MRRAATNRVAERECRWAAEHQEDESPSPDGASRSSQERIRADEECASTRSLVAVEWRRLGGHGIDWEFVAHDRLSRSRRGHLGWRIAQQKIRALGHGCAKDYLLSVLIADRHDRRPLASPTGIRLGVSAEACIARVWAGLKAKTPGHLVVPGVFIWVA